MLFNLKNEGATYQRPITIIFHDILHDCLKDYVYHIVVKLGEARHQTDDLRKST